MSNGETLNDGAYHTVTIELGRVGSVHFYNDCFTKKPRNVWKTTKKQETFCVLHSPTEYIMLQNPNYKLRAYISV